MTQLLEMRASKDRYLHDNTISKNWTPIVRKRFLFMVTEALTNYNSQVDAYEYVVIQIKPCYGLHIALSRAKMLQIYSSLVIPN